ncbi:MAG: hypothetical protein V1269_16025 [Deltaproteobacteria bacterium]|nr:hypothetical protein [Deltaproteobacteria bacterium]
MPPYFFAGLLVLFLVTAWYGVWLFREKRMLRKTSLILRTALFALIIFLTLETLKSSLSVPKPLFVLFDGSESMRIEENGFSENVPIKLPRAAETFIREEYPDREIHAYDLFRVDEEREAKGSPISEALIRFLDRSGIKSTQELLLFSDGQDSVHSGMPRQAAKHFREAGIRLNTLASANYAKGDLSVESVAHPRVAFVDQLTTIRVRVRSNFSMAVSTHLLLLDGQSILHRKRIDLNPDNPVQELELKWMPVRSGEALLSLELQSLEEEQFHNNFSYLPVSIREKRMRVLHIAGRPSWDVFHLRRLLKEMPEVDMIAFFILRDPFEDTQTVPEKELALIRFPVQELFMRQLFKFDTVVFHNFDIRRFLRNAQFQRSFQKFLAGGKRIIVVGGEQVVGHRDYQELFLSGTSSQKLKLEFRHRTDWNFRERRLLPVHDLQHQPAFAGDLEEDYNQSSELLLRTPYRKGRVDWVLEPQSWSWKLGNAQPLQKPVAAADFLGIRHRHASFWQTLLFQPIRMRQRIFRDFSPGRPYHDMETIQGWVHLPTRSASASFRLVEESNSGIRFETELPLNEGKAKLRLPMLEPGAYRLEASCGCGDMEDVSHPIRVVSDWQEMNKIGPHHAWLEWISRETGGQSWKLDESQNTTGS